MGTPAEELLIRRARVIARAKGKEWDTRLESILRFCACHPEFFPRKRNIRPESIDQISDVYLEPYISNYYEEREGVIRLPDIKTVADPVVNEVLMAFGNKQRGELPEIADSHRLSMQAENLVGNLLERYVATLLEKKGWVWCCGRTMKAIDFLKDEDLAEPKLLQIKNQDNSENSSSSAIRAGTTIKKWYRRNARSGRTRWDKCPENDNASDDERLTEEGFYRFVAEAAQHITVAEASETQE